MDWGQIVVAATAGGISVLAIQRVISRMGRVPPHVAHQNRILSSLTGIEMATVKLGQHLRQLEDRMRKVEKLKWPEHPRPAGTGSK